MYKIKTAKSTYLAPASPSEADFAFWMRISEIVAGNPAHDELCAAFIGCDKSEVEGADGMIAENLWGFYQHTLSWLADWGKQVEKAKPAPILSMQSLPREWMRAPFRAHVMADDLQRARPKGWQAKFLAIYVAADLGGGWEEAVEEAEREVLALPATAAVPVFFWALNSTPNFRRLGPAPLRGLLLRLMRRLLTSSAGLTSSIPWRKGT